jgi:cephalosporin hydroxylase
MLTREEFEALRLASAEKMAADKALVKKAQDVLLEADKYHWIHQSTWFGEPILNVPQDTFAIQDIIYKTRPKYIVEIGVAWGGSLLFYSTLMEILGGVKIIGVDIYIPEDLKQRIFSHEKLAGRIELIEASSTEMSTLEKVKQIVGDSKEVMVNLDSYHTHAHVLKELQLYSTLVSKGHYLICGDTIVEDFPEQQHRIREWGPGNNPKTALWQFMKENNRFISDTQVENKLLFTCNPEGFLRCIKD